MSDKSPEVSGQRDAEITRTHLGPLNAISLIENGADNENIKDVVQDFTTSHLGGEGVVLSTSHQKYFIPSAVDGDILVNSRLLIVDSWIFEADLVDNRAEVDFCTRLWPSLEPT